MKTMQSYSFWPWYLRSRGAALVCFLVFGGIFALVFRLYDLPLEAVLYPWLLCLALGVLVLLFDILRLRRSHRQYALLLEQTDPDMDLLPLPANLAEAQLQQLLRQLARQNQSQRSLNRTQEQETMDYFAAWVHQIKTPIAAIGMLLQGEDSEEHRAIQMELLRIEHYVDMVLGYLRLSSASSDYVFQETELDQVIRDSIRRFAPLFVHKRIQLEYAGTEERIVTDGKWLRFILDQLLSNAVKYTNQGRITIRVQDQRITVEDTGIGIAPEDLPRIFEQGFTGCNGREDEKSTGLGLYLCQCTAQRLGILLMASSAPGQGTSVQLSLRRVPLNAE